MDTGDLSVAFKSAPNIALVKYWGKFSQSEIIPINDSIGLTLNTDDISSTTVITFTPKQHQDTFLLNQKPSKLTNRMINVLDKVRRKARISDKFKNMSQYQWSRHHFKIESQNSFPSASGMASSASGYSCLAAGLNHLFGGIFNNEQLSRLARTGSGSASRALYGGLVRWVGVDQKLLTLNHEVTSQQLQQISDKSISFPVVDSRDLSFIKIIAVITENKQKDISSTLGMRTSRQTSLFMNQRNQIANSRIEQMIELIKRINQSKRRYNKQEEYRFFSQLAELIIRDSNSFHAVCLDTYPPIFYMNDFSKQIVSMVDRVINKETKQTKVAYTFDAGPHGFLFVHEDMLDSVLLHVHRQFGSRYQILNAKARKIIEINNHIVNSAFTIDREPKIMPKGIWVTDVGRGAEQVRR